MKVECGDPSNTGFTSATTMGIKVRHKITKETRITLAYHGFLQSPDVYHPNVRGTLIGTVKETFPHIDVALMQLHPQYETKFSNINNFNAPSPIKMLKKDEVMQGSWYEVDGMSSGLVQLMVLATEKKRPPLRPEGHVKVPYCDWDHQSLARISGATNNSIKDGMCGAPIVHCGDFPSQDGEGEVAGFFWGFDGDMCITQHLDDLINAGWEVVVEG